MLWYKGELFKVIDLQKKHAKPQWLTWYVKFTGTNNCEHEGPTNTITDCNFSITRSVFEKVGGFDEHFTRLALREDADYGMRCFRQGFSMLWTSDRGI